MIYTPVHAHARREIDRKGQRGTERESKRVCVGERQTDRQTGERVCVCWRERERERAACKLARFVSFFLSVRLCLHLSILLTHTHTDTHTHTEHEYIRRP